LPLVLVLVVLAKPSGEDYPYGIAQWGRGRQRILCEVWAANRPTLPSHNTYRRVLGDAVERAELQAIVAEHLTQPPGAGQSVLVALEGKIVRRDALLAQRSLSTQIVEAGGEYVWLIKDNHPQLRQDIEQLFQPETCVAGFSPAPKDFRAAQKIEHEFAYRP